MPITINGSGTVTGITAGGLPDGVITTDDIAANAVTYAKIGTTEQGQLCKAWVNFNGTSTVSIRASYNVSSITDRGTGNYTVNFTNALADANYSTIINAGGGFTTILLSDNGPNLNSGGYSTTHTTTTGIKFVVGNQSTSVPNDADTLAVAIFR